MELRMPKTYRKWIYAKPMVDDALGPEQFALRELPIPELQQDQALVRVKLVNIHSATRLRMARAMTKLGDTDLSNYACAEVIQSRDKTFKEGDIIACQAGWQDHQIISSDDASVGYGRPSELVKALNGTNSQWNYVFRPAMARMRPADARGCRRGRRCNRLCRLHRRAACEDRRLLRGRVRRRQRSMQMGGGYPGDRQMHRLSRQRLRGAARGRIPERHRRLRRWHRRCPDGDRHRNHEAEQPTIVLWERGGVLRRQARRAAAPSSFTTGVRHIGDCRDRFEEAEHQIRSMDRRRVLP